MKLYEIAEGYRNILEFAENEEVEQEHIIDAIAAVEESFVEKLTNTTNIVRELEADSEKIDKEIKRLQAIKKRLDTTKDNIKMYMLSCMVLAGEKTVKGDLNTWSVRSSKAVEIVDEEAVPSEFIKVETVTKVDKKAITAALKVGEVSGCKFKENKSLVIK